MVFEICLVLDCSLFTLNNELLTRGESLPIVTIVTTTNVGHQIPTMESVVVSELPARFPGRQHVQRNHYVTAEFPHEAMSTIGQNFTRATPRRAQIWNRQCMES